MARSSGVSIGPGVIELMQMGALPSFVHFSAAWDAIDPVTVMMKALAPAYNGRLGSGRMPVRSVVLMMKTDDADGDRARTMLR